MAQHCLQYSAQRVSVEVATCCSIRYIEDWKKDATLPAILRTTCFSGGGYTAASLRATRTGNMVSTSPPILCAACFSGGCNMLQHYV